MTSPVRVARSGILEHYLARTRGSAARYERTRQWVAGGNSREAAFWLPYPLCLDRAEGGHVWDVDNNRYLDLNFNYTAMVHGHAYPPIVEAVQRQVPKGTGWAANCEAQADLAEQLIERVRSIDLVRFCNSGTEAANVALMIARIVTGRHKVLMARYGYHGSLWEHETGTYDHPGPDTLLAHYGDLASFERVLSERGDEVAAVFLEPVMGGGGIKAGSREFLHGVERAARKARALFVMDEVITFRLGPGGRHQELGLRPDLVMFGKVIGGGFPVGAIGGKEEHMRLFDPANLRAHHSGTYNANPVTMTAGAVAVRHLTAERIVRMAQLAESLRHGLEGAAQRIGLPLSFRHEGSLLALYFQPRAPENAVERQDQELMSSFHLAALNNGVMIAPRGMITVATVTDESTIGEIVDRLTLAMADVANELG